MVDSSDFQAFVAFAPGIIDAGGGNYHKRQVEWRRCGCVHSISALIVLRFRCRFITPRKTGHAVVKSRSGEANNDEL